MERQRRLPDGSFGPMEVVFPQVADPNLLAAFETIAMQSEMLMEQQFQIGEMKSEIQTLNGVLNNGSTIHDSSHCFF